MVAITCPCKFPILVKYDGIVFIGFPVNLFDEGTVELPLIDDEIDDNGKHWIKVQWSDELHDGVQHYEVVNHDVIAGCDENQLTCDSKNVYIVRHPKEEWDDYHIIDVDELMRNK